MTSKSQGDLVTVRRARIHGLQARARQSARALQDVEQERDALRQELEVIREVPGEPSIAIEVAEHAESDSDSDDDTDSDDSDDSDTDSDSEDSASAHSESSSLKPQPSFFNHQPPRRSPLAQSSEGVFESVYKGYHCTISGCDFAASTAEHVRHHLRTASHWYLLDTGMD